MTRPVPADVRRATTDDVPAILLVRERAIRVSAAEVYDAATVDAWASGGSSERLRHLVAQALGVVATVDGEVVGWACLEGEEVQQLYVHPEHGGRGVARAMYEALERAAVDSGTVRLRTTASLRSAPAFDRFGFTERSRGPEPFPGGPVEVVRMGKELRDGPGPTAPRTSPGGHRKMSGM
ncbi:MULTISPECIES: GNAT family N-acetyltransferase [unclassified Actinotalea]|uniref:GNAT family N-acetyltransferase n=1 Tax=unclassified Actinotalea TaxID=2638618 RepID=UPI0015F48189|nr:MULTISPECIES: GNAT family N-acetyltransferase [unclassified Actinotalea]